MTKMELVRLCAEFGVRAMYCSTNDTIVELLQKKNKIIEKPVACTAIIKCVAMLTDISGKGFGLRFSWKKQQSEKQSLEYYDFWLGDAVGNEHAIYREITQRIGGGFATQKDFRDYVFTCTLLARKGIIPTLQSTSRAGWGVEYKTYSAEGYKYPENAPEYMGKATPARWRSAGDEEQYIARIKHILRTEPHIALICGFFVAGSIVKIVGAENNILSLVGRTSTGKTLALKTALSLRGDAESFATFDSTPGALKALLQASADGCLAIDEIGQSGLTPEQRQKFIYDVSQGRERARLRKIGEDYCTKAAEKVFYTVITTGEVCIGAQSHAEGAQVRVTEIAFSENKPLWYNITNNAQAEELELFLKENHGWIMPRVIRYIAENVENVYKLYASTLNYMRSAAGDEAQENGIKRKVKAMALATSGVSLLFCALGMCEADDVQAEQAAMQAALAVVQESVEAYNTNDDNDKYYDFLASIKIKYAERLLNVATDPKAVIGEFNGGKLKIIKSEMEALCAKEKIDLQRLLKWADEKNVLITAKNGAGNKRYTKRLTIDGIKVYAYEVDIERLQTID